jgi:hypothetical protein
MIAIAIPRPSVDFNATNHGSGVDSVIGWSHSARRRGHSREEFPRDTDRLDSVHAGRSGLQFAGELSFGSLLPGFSVHPDGTRFVTSLWLWPSDIWMLEGFDRR